MSIQGRLLSLLSRGKASLQCRLVVATDFLPEDEFLLLSNAINALQHCVINTNRAHSAISKPVFNDFLHKHSNSLVTVDIRCRTFNRVHEDDISGKAIRDSDLERVPIGLRNLSIPSHLMHLPDLLRCLGASEQLTNVDYYFHIADVRKVIKTLQEWLPALLVESRRLNFVLRTYEYEDVEREQVRAKPDAVEEEEMDELWSALGLRKEQNWYKHIDFGVACHTQDSTIPVWSTPMSNNQRSIDRWSAHVPDDTSLQLHQRPKISNTVSQIALGRTDNWTIRKLPRPIASNDHQSVSAGATTETLCPGPRSSASTMNASEEPNRCVCPQTPKEDHGDLARLPIVVLWVHLQNELGMMSVLEVYELSFHQ